MFMLENIHQFNKIYSKDEKTLSRGYTSIPEYYRTSFYVREIYHSPVGWRRHALYMNLSNEQFEKKYRDCPVGPLHTTVLTAEII